MLPSGMPKHPKKERQKLTVSVFRQIYIKNSNTKMHIYLQVLEQFA